SARCSLPSQSGVWVFDQQVADRETAPLGFGGEPARSRPTSFEGQNLRMRVVEIETPRGPARAHLHPSDAPRAALVLGHGAGGGVEAPDLLAATEAAHAKRLSVALVEQPYRVAGRRSPSGPAQLDAAWTAVVEALRADELS